MVADIFKYRARDCKTENEIIMALAHYRSLEDQLVEKGDIGRFNDTVNSLEKKLSAFYIADEQQTAEHLSDELLNKDRVFYYHRCIVLSVEFLQKNPDIESLECLFVCLKESLKLHDVEWNVQSHYSDSVVFHNAFTPSEKAVQFVHHVLISGLREKRTIISLINQFIKLVNSMQLVDQLSVDLPNRRTLHNISFVFPEFKY